MNVSDIAVSLCDSRTGATGGCGRRTGGNPGRGGIPGPGPRVDGGPLRPLSFLNLDLILNSVSFSFSRKMYAIAPMTVMIAIIRIQSHHAELSSVVLVRQQTCGVLHEYVVTGSWNSEHSSMQV